MNSLIAILFASMSLFAQTNNQPSSTNINLKPISISVPGHIRYASAYVVDLGSSMLAMNIIVKYRHYSGSLSTQSYTLPIIDARTVRKGNDLYLIYNDNETLLAHHESWYYPYWSIKRDNVLFLTNLQVTTASRSKANLYPQVVILK